MFLVQKLWPKKKHFGKPKSAGKLWWCKVMQEKWLLTHDFKVRACRTPDPDPNMISKCEHVVHQIPTC